MFVVLKVFLFLEIESSLLALHLNADVLNSAGEIATMTEEKPKR